MCVVGKKHLYSVYSQAIKMLISHVYMCVFVCAEQHKAGE